MGVWKQSPQLGLEAEPLVRRKSPPPEAETHDFWTFTEGCKFVHFLQNLKCKISDTICVVFAKK